MYNPRFKWRDDEAFPDDDGVCPDFAGIAERLSEMQKLETRGWWGETSFDPEQEEVMRTVKDTLKGVRVALAGDALHLVDARPLIGTCRAPLLKELLHAHLGRDYEDAGVVHVTCTLVALCGDQLVDGGLGEAGAHGNLLNCKQCVCVWHGLYPRIWRHLGRDYGGLSHRSVAPFRAVSSPHCRYGRSWLSTAAMTSSGLGGLPKVARAMASDGRARVTRSITNASMG